MTITSAGYQGTVNESQWSRLFDIHPYWCDGNGGQVAAVASARQVTVADGTVYGRGVRDVLASVPALVLAPPASGGLWYLVVARRTWGNAAATTVVALSGAATDGTVPTILPTALPAGFNSNPGTADDQPLAWVHVRAADTTLTVFDLRVMLTGSGGVRVASLYALGNHTSLFRTFGDGSLVAVPEHAPLTGGATLRASVWRVRTTAGNTYAVPEISMQGTGGIVNNLSTLFAPGAGIQGIALTTLTGLKVQDELSGIIYRYVGSGNTNLGGANTTALFQAWEKAPAPWTGGLGGGITGGSGISISGQWGISAGQVWGACSVAAGAGYSLSSTGDATFNLPSSYVGSLGAGGGQYLKAGSTGGGNQIPLSVYGIGSFGTQQTIGRIRALYMSSTTVPSQNILGSVITSSTTDTFQFNYSGPSAAVA